MPHTYHHIPDVAAGLATLGTAADEVFGRVWMLPCAPADPARALVARFASALGREIRVTGVPPYSYTIVASPGSSHRDPANRTAS